MTDPVHFLFVSMAGLVDDKDYDAVDGPEGMPKGQAIHSLMDSGGMVIDWAEFRRGNLRINKTERDTREVLEDYRSYLQDESKSGDCCKCRNYFLGNGMIPLTDEEMR